MKFRQSYNSPQHFDVIIVYTGEVARSAADASYTQRAPFPRYGGSFSYNKSYKYFLQYCKQRGLRAAFATTNDICGPGMFRAVWVYGTSWQRKHRQASTRLVFDKFSGVLDQHIVPYTLLMGEPGNVRLFHNPKMREVFDNKFNTFERFSEYAIPTVKIGSLSKKNIASAKRKLNVQLSKHRFKKDFTGGFVLKDQFGAGGTNIFKLHGDAHAATKAMTDSTAEFFVLQPMIDASGFHFGKYGGIIDLRVILCNGAVVQSYIRIAKKGEFRANAKQGGAVVYLENAMVPDDVRAMIAAINRKLPVRNSLYALDFIKSSAGHLYLMEGNSTPGLNWYDEEDERRAKELMRFIIKKIVAMV